MTKEELKSKLNQIHKMDCLKFVSELPENSIDVIVTSPPYNLGNTNKSETPKRVKHEQGKNRGGVLFTEGYDEFDDCLPYSKYCLQQDFLLKHLIRALKPDGAIFYNIKLRIYNGLTDYLPAIFEGKPIRQVIRWNKYSTLSYSSAFLLPKHEEIFLIVKSEDSLLKFNPEGIKLGTIWEFNKELENKHPAPFPLQLPYNAISCIDRPKGYRGVVYDPYMGSGTTAIAAELLGWDWIGTDLSDEYIEMAQNRLEKNRLRPETVLKTDAGKNHKFFDNDKFEKSNTTAKKLNF